MVANYAPHDRLTMGGRLLQTNLRDEVWTCTINLTPLPANGDHIQAALDVGARLRLWFNSQPAFMASTAFLDYVKLNPVGQNGHYLDPNASYAFDLAPPVPGVKAPMMPTFTSVCTTWLTAKQRGPGSKGRVFLPNYTVGNTNSVAITAAEQDAIARAGLTLLQTIHADPTSNTPGIPVVASSVNATLSKITGVAVGNIYDVQRRRKNAYKEIYRGLAYTPA